jgi:hypothetical protein
VSGGDAVLATMIAGSCFIAIYYFSQLIQFLFGTLFGCLLLLSLTKKGTPWSLIFVLSLIGLTTSHLLSGIYMLFILGVTGTYKSVSRIQHNLDRDQTTGLDSSKLALVAVFVLSWLSIAALFYIPTIANIFHQGFSAGYAKPSFRLSPELENLLKSSAGHAETSPTSNAALQNVLNPLPIRVISDIGVVLFGSILTLGFVFLKFRRRERRLAGLLPYAFGSAALFAAHLVLFSFAFFGLIEDILARGFLWVYLIASPLAVFTLGLVWPGLRPSATANLQSNDCGAHQQRLRARPILVYLTIILILLSSMYYHYPLARYDKSQPANADGFATLVRLPLEQWVSVGIWSSTHIRNNLLYGDKVAFVYVGALATKHIVQFPQNGSLQGWLHSMHLSGAMLVLRISILTEPNYQLSVDSNQLSSIIEHNNVIYNSGDPVIIVVRG